MTKRAAKPNAARSNASKAVREQSVIWTIGHSTRPIDDFLQILAAGQIKLLADVRRFPGSRRHPHFGQEAIAASLAEAGIAYRHFVDLGGRRSQRLPDSPNSAWRVKSFNAYADYMQSPEFLAALKELMATAQQQPTAIMCSEALPQRCHRRLISDALVARGWFVHHLLSPKRIEDHVLTPFARVSGTTLTYPSETLF
jgi:uncharacterized protein (DUF488 family)